MIRAFLPVSESFGFTGYLRSHTAGQAFHNCSFHNYATIGQDPLAVNENQVTSIVKDIRKRKGLKEEVPPLNNYEDKL